MLEKAIATTRCGQYAHVQYARFADDVVILIDSHPRNDWLLKAVDRRLREELVKLHRRRLINFRKYEFAELDAHNFLLKGNQGIVVINVPWYLAS